VHALCACRKQDLSWSSCGSPANNEKNDKQDNAEDKENPGYVGCGAGNAGKAEDRCDECYDEKNYCPFKHDASIMVVIVIYNAFTVVVHHLE